MRIPIVNKSIQQRLHSIGVQGENHVEEITFVLKRMYRDIDLSEGLAYIYISNTKKGVLAVKLETEIESINGKETGHILLKWLIGSECTQTKGMLNVQLVINGLNDELWKSEISTFTVAQAIDYPTPLPIMYSNQGVRPILEEHDNEPPITISNRKFFIPKELQNIAVQNDENSEAVKVILPRYFDGHDLSKYTIALKTVSQGGRSDVVFSTHEKDILENEIHLTWTLKPPETSYAGALELQLFVTGQGFKWETDVGEVTILKSLDAEPVIPMTPSFIDEFIKNLQANINKVETGATIATEQAAIATSKAEEAKMSIEQVEASKNEVMEQVKIATEQVGYVNEQAIQVQTNAEQAKNSADSAARSAELAQQIKNSTEIFYDIDTTGNRVGFRRADESDFTYTASLKGKDGLTVSVNGVTHDETGNITLTPKNIGAATAEQFQGLSEADVELLKQIEVLSYKYREAPLSALDDLPTLLGITPKNGMILGTMFSETIAPYLFGGTRYTVEEYYYLPTYRVQIAKGSYQNTGYMKERKMINGVWGEWVDYSTTTKTDILSSELLNGWVFDDASIEENIIKTGNIVSLHLVIKNPAVQGNNSHIYTIPSQYRPTKIVARDTKLRNSNTSIIIEVLPTGILRCNGYTEVNRTLSIDISWGVLT